MGHIKLQQLVQEIINGSKVDHYVDRNGNQFQAVDVNTLQYPGRVLVKYAGSNEPVEYKGNFDADLKSGIIRYLDSEINEAFFIGEDEPHDPDSEETPLGNMSDWNRESLDEDNIDEYDVENEADVKEFVEFMREYKQQLDEAECGCVFEAEYHGRKVTLGKPMQGDIKKFKVYVKNNKGKVVKVNFGFGGKSAKGKRMVIKAKNPKRRSAYRKRHHCDNPGPRWKANYWSCRKW